MNNEYLVATIQTFTDGDGIDQYSMNTCVLPKEKALSKLTGRVIPMGSKLICKIDGETGRVNYGSYGECYLVVCPATNNMSIDGDEITYFMGQENWAEFCGRKEVETMQKEIEENISEESWSEILADENDEEEESLKGRRRMRIKGNAKAKRRLAELYPISTNSIRKTRNGAYIHKGNTYKWNSEWKRLDTKARREEGKAEIRNYIHEEETFNEAEIRRTPTEIEEEITKLDTFVNELRDEIKWLEKRVDNLQERRLQLILGLEDEPRHWSY